MKRAATALALAALALGCGGKKRAPRPIADDAAVAGPTVRDLTPPSRAPFPEPVVAMPKELRATLLAPGAAPRAVRRYRPIAETRELRVTMAITASGFRNGAWSDPTALPAITEGFGIITEAGGATVALRGLVGEVAAGGTDATRADAESYLGRWRKLLERRRLAVAVDDRGRLGAITAHDDPAGASDATKDELVQRWLGLAVPLPAEPIGVGARWRVVTLLRTGGAVLKQTATYTLTAADASGLTVEVELVRVGEQQLIEVPGLPADVTAELIALRREVKGTLVVGPGSPLARTGHLTSSSSAHARWTGPTGAVDEVSDDTATVELTAP